MAVHEVQRSFLHACCPSSHRPLRPYVVNAYRAVASVRYGTARPATHDTGGETSASRAACRSTTYCKSACLDINSRSGNGATARCLIGELSRTTSEAVRG